MKINGSDMDLTIIKLNGYKFNELYCYSNTRGDPSPPIIVGKFLFYFLWWSRFEPFMVVGLNLGPYIYYVFVSIN
jgi:hypothetical protein